MHDQEKGRGLGTISYHFSKELECAMKCIRCYLLRNCRKTIATHVLAVANLKMRAKGTQQNNTFDHMGTTSELGTLLRKY